jgi:hypothetical protein
MLLLSWIAGSLLSSAQVFTGSNDFSTDDSGFAYFFRIEGSGTGNGNSMWTTGF